MELFKCSLKPKHHFLLHYPRIIKQIGPPVFLSTERKEAKHKDFKTNSHIIRSRKNVPYSLSLRIQEKCCYRTLAKRGLNDIVNFGPFQDVNDIDIGLRDRFDFSKYHIISWYELNGIKYFNDNIFHYKNDNSPVLCQIKNILLDTNNYKNVYFLCNYVTLCEYNDHIRAHKIDLSFDDTENQIMITSLKEVFAKIPLTVYRLLDSTYVTFNIID